MMHKPRNPYRELCLSVLKRAVRDLDQGRGTETRERHRLAADNAVRWMDGAGAPLPFEACCDTAGVSGAAVRRRAGLDV